MIRVTVEFVKLRENDSENNGMEVRGFKVWRKFLKGIMISEYWRFNLIIVLSRLGFFGFFFCCFIVIFLFVVCGY